MINEKLEELKNEMIDMAKLVEEMLNKAFEVPDKNIDCEIIDNMENEINKYELKIEEKCIQVIALYQLEASNLRFVVMILKINNHLERMGDLAFKIANSFNYLKKHEIVQVNGDVMLMKNTTLQMLRNVLKAFLNKDVELAKSVWERDDVIDNLQKKVFKDIRTRLVKHEISELLSFNKNRIANAVERSADLITNIAEDIIYIETGEIIKHPEIK